MYRTLIPAILLSAGLSLAGLSLTGCEQAAMPASEKDRQTAAFSLPEPVSNNAAALADGAEGPTLYSFNGLKSGKEWSDTSNAAFACAIATKTCTAIAPVPVSEGRLASAAVTVAGKIYVIGGYTVAENGDELSAPEMFAFDPADNSYTRLADMPTPVDDMVALSYKDRYIYLISGWHDEGNVSLVQMYDTQADEWTAASAFPGKPVFGHAGGLVGNSMIITDGVAVIFADGKRKFVAAPFAWRGDINPQNPAQIIWRGLDPHPGGARYRMAAMGDEATGRVVFAGGGDNPYNYNGIGYDGTPSKATDRIFAYDIARDKWLEQGSLPHPSMDHRGLMKSGDDYYIVGGMDHDLQVLDRIITFRISAD